MNQKELIGLRIKEARLKKRLKQSEISQKVGITPITLSRYERGLYLPTLDIGIRLLLCLDMDISQFKDLGSCQ